VHFKQFNQIWLEQKSCLVQTRYSKTIIPFNPHTVQECKMYLLFSRRLWGLFVIVSSHHMASISLCKHKNRPFSAAAMSPSCFDSLLYFCSNRLNLEDSDLLKAAYLPANCSGRCKINCNKTFFQRPRAMPAQFINFKLCRCPRHLLVLV